MHNNQGDAIGIFSIFSIIVLAVGLMNHVMVIPPLLHEAKRDAWISVLASALPYLAWTAVLYYIMRKTEQQPILGWLQSRYGKAPGVILRLFMSVYLYCIAIMTLKDTTTWTHAMYLPRTPPIVLDVSLILLCFFAAQFGLKAIAITSGILLPFVILFGDFVMSANLPVKNYALLTPVLENGAGPVVRGMVYIGGGLAELIILLLLQHQFKSKVRFAPMCLLALFLVFLILGPVTGAIAEFGPFEASELRYPAFEEWRLVRIGKYIQHVDFLSIYQWLSGAFVRIAISIFLLGELFASGSSPKRRTVWLLLFGIVLAVSGRMPISDMQYLIFLRTVYLPASLWCATGLLLALFGLALFSSNTSKGGSS